MRVYVPLSNGTSAGVWELRHRRGEVPDRSPYGLHHLGQHGFDVSFGDRDLTGGLERIARSLRYRTNGLEPVELVKDVRAMRRTRTDVVLAYDERAGVPASLLAPRRLFAPVVTGVGWLTTPDDTPRLERDLALRALPRAAAVWTQCSAMLPSLTDHWGVPAERVHVVPLGIDTEFYAEQPWDLAGPRVASAGEDRYRDHALLLDAVRRVRATLPDVRLDLATGLPTDMTDVDGRLFTERMGGRMRDLYAGASVVALALAPTPTGSGLTVVLEAMASGRAVVVTGNPGVDDYVEHGVTGLLVPPGDVDAFADALRSLLADPDRACAMGAAGAEAARTRFSSAAMSGVIADLLRASI